MEVKDWTEAHGVVRLWEALRGSYLGSIRVLQRGFRGALGIKGSRFRIQDSKITHLNPQAYNPRPPALSFEEAAIPGWPSVGTSLPRILGGLGVL